jgi:hypothetical protein
VEQVRFDFKAYVNAMDQPARKQLVAVLRDHRPPAVVEQHLLRDPQDAFVHRVNPILVHLCETAPMQLRERGQDVINAIAEAQDQGYYQITFKDQAGAQLTVVRLSLDALVELAETARTLAMAARA